MIIMLAYLEAFFHQTDQFIAFGETKDKAYELVSQIWIAVVNNLEENEQTFLLLKYLAQEGDVSDTYELSSVATEISLPKSSDLPKRWSMISLYDETINLPSKSGAETFAKKIYRTA